MPFLLMVFLVLLSLPEPRDWTEPLWLTDSPWDCILATGLTVLLTTLYACRITRRFSRSIDAAPALRERFLQRYERDRFRHLIAVYVSYLVSLFGLGWGWAIAQLWVGQTGTLPGAELLILSPFVAAQVMAWAVFYDAERAVHRAAQRLLAAESQTGGWLELERTRASGPPVFGSRMAYVLFQLRQKLALAFLPALLLLMLKDLQRLFPAAWQEWQKSINFLGIGAVLLVFIALPWIIRLILGLKPLPAGPLRSRLEAAARRLRFRYSNILLWNTRSGMANAMVVGILPWVRYVVFTDRLLEDFSPEETEAVFGHEVGHVRHHHMLYYFSFLTASVIVLFCLINEVCAYFHLTEWLDPRYHQSGWFSSAALVIVLLAYIFMVFGFLSRRCERQADVFGCRAVSCPNPHCEGHDRDIVLPPRGQGLCPTGVDTFIRALEKVAFVNGISRDRPGFLQSWQHSTIGRRVEFLRRMRNNPGVERNFQRRTAWVKWSLLLVLCGTIGVLLFRESSEISRLPNDDEPARPSLSKDIELRP